MSKIRFTLWGATAAAVVTLAATAAAADGPHSIKDDACAAIFVDGLLPRAIWWRGQ